MTSAEHLEDIDPDLWPGIVEVPSGWGMSTRARVAEARFAQACEKAGLRLEGVDADLIVDHEELFPRLAQHGWVGLAESWMAGEWRARDLSHVLSALLSADYHPRRRRPRFRFDPYDGGALPPELIRVSSPDGMSFFGGLFTGVSTTERQAMTSYVPGAGRGSEAATHFVDVTHIDDPQEVERADLSDAQQRALERLLDETRVGPGSHILEYPASGGLLAVEAARRRATVDVLSADEDMLASMNEPLVLAGVADSVHLQPLEHPVATARDWRGRYDAILSMEYLELLSEQERRAFVRSIERLLGSSGRAGIQMVTATPAMPEVAREALDALRLYIWPDLRYPTVEDVHRLIDRYTTMRVIAQSHSAGHYERCLELQHSHFLGMQREAAADGFDAVFRRMWEYQFALRRVLFEHGWLDAVQFTVTARHRRGRR
ncbi:class I SAM-dependent methyltransferase [Corynebacterium uropygiale]|uniref:Class I SAM-dependent methyltransferase n=1 Tax=Corynebacterium uropygiale TaxID=1775911 RepID=A0A9X1QQ00_9CORY|nr:class I SAM-dependent methyltransferase [Corynebacterium uropygiale]